MKLTQEQAEKVVAYAKEIAGEDVTITDVAVAVQEYDEATQRWIYTVATIMEDYSVSEAVANAALAAVLDDHEIRGALWTAAVVEIMERDSVNEVQANENLLNLLRHLEAERA